jgi:hypothetical protein
MLVGALVLAPATASADLVVHLDQISADGGTLTADVGINQFAAGQNILFNVITLEDSILGTLGTLYCGLNPGGTTTATACTLFFDTSQGGDNFYVIANGGVFDPGGTQILAAGSIVLAGSISPNGVGIQTTFSGSEFTAHGTDTKNPAILEYFRLFVVGDFEFSDTEALLGTVDQNCYLGGSGIQCQGTVGEADIINQGNIQRIPEPGLLTLFGVGLLGVGRKLARRRA